ncbi:ATP-binding protein [Persicitalea jodogahamensis]|uniref:histidine kinase n=1 Tax=Persicitalea jodogahamensis TaxID=402147 RepID=A0A8J3D6Q6_9BACT|nr:ATP-binding protein [Persicitalea jodogahamensis]GHB58256.1 hypothetical protein GCM10007390_09680 [Persicitalea jodogahamensis]
MKRLCLLLVPFLLSLYTSGQVVTLDVQTSTPLVISPDLSQFVDTTKALSLAEVQDKEFTLVGRHYFPLPYSDATFWFRFTLRNNDPNRDRWYLEWDNPTVEIAECYLPDSSGSGFSSLPRSVKRAGTRSPYFAIDLPQGKEQTVYLRIRSQHGYRMTVNIHDDASLLASKVALVSSFSFTSGMVFLRLFFVLLLAIFAVREKAFLAYCFLLVVRSLGFWGLLGGMGGVFTDDQPTGTLIDYLSYHFIPIGYVVVVYALLPPDRLPRLARFVLNGIAITVLGLGVIIMFDYRWYWLLTSQYVVLFSQFFILGLYGYAVAKRWSVNWYYSVPFLLGLGSYCFMVLGDVNIIDAEWVFAIAYLLFMGEIFIFGLFLGKIILDYRRQQEDSQQKLVWKETEATKLKELDTLKTNFFANISHEFRTPLTMLVGPLEDFRQQLPDNPLIPAMQRNVRRLKVLIDQLLDLSRLEAGHLRPAIVQADLPTFLRQLFASFESLAHSRKMIFNYQQNVTSREACFDADKLEKIVTNLLSNAFKFTPDGGRVNVQVEYADNELSLKVQDYGVGIEAVRLPHIFDRFYRVESTGQNNTEGAGIGLSLVNELVKVLKGQIRAESEPGRGSTFTVRLPIDRGTWADYLTDAAPELDLSALPAEAEATIQETGTRNAAPLPKKPKAPDSDAPLVLLVEDNPDLRAYMQDIFQENYRVMVATDGQDGLDRAFEEIPDLVICDVMMPRLDGYGFCEKLKSDPRTSHIPVVMLTAKASLADRLAGLELGADDYLIKPFNRAELELRVQNLLKQRELLRQKYSQQMAEPAASGGRASATQTLDEKFLKKAILIVRERSSESSFGIDELCEALNTSRSNLHRKLKALTGQSTTEFIRSIRLYRAAELLKQPGASISEICYAVGFENPAYFSRTFSEQMGVTPSEWAMADSA